MFSGLFSGEHLSILINMPGLQIFKHIYIYIYRYKEKNCLTMVEFEVTRSNTRSHWCIG